MNLALWFSGLLLVAGIVPLTPPPPPTGPTLVSYDIDLTPGPLINQIVRIPLFNPSLGTLLSVDIGGSFVDHATYGQETDCGSASEYSTGDYIFTVSCSATDGTNAIPLGSAQVQRQLTTSGPYDGTMDFDGSSGKTRDVFFGHGGHGIPSSFAPYIGVGRMSIYVLVVENNIVTLQGTCSTTQTSVVSNLSGHLKVTYTYQ